MRLDPDDDALDFGASVRDLLTDAASPAALRAAWDSEDGRVPGLWKRLVELGVPAATIPEEYGGLGLDLRALLPMIIETGRAAIPEPLVETIVGAHLLAAAGGDVAEHWLPRVVDGSATIGVGLGPGQLVSGAPWADLLLMRDDVGAAHAVETADVTIRPAPSIDAGIRLAEVEWQPVDATRLGSTDDAGAADYGLDLAVVAASAQLLGLADAMLDRGVRYAQQREQFGSVIGTFQAVKHQLADAYVAIAFAKPVVLRATWSVATGSSSGWRDASHAKIAAGRAASGAARTALQVHAGIGYTFEHDLHIWMKRAWSLIALWGTTAWHHARVADAVLED
jgi:alkylation response protein AidB-like acyl-CoA dehydrogenase